jgi:PAS domain S-box-containing protein
LPVNLPDATWILDSADDAIVCHDRQGRITLWNRAAERLLGYAAADVLGRDISLVFPPEAQQEIAAALVRIDGGEYATSSDRVLVTRSLQRIAAWVAISPIRDPAGQLIGASYICRPTDRTHSTLAALHLGAVVASSDDVIISKGLDGIVQSWNPAAERLFGFTAAEMIGRSIRTIIPSDRQQEEDEVLAKVRVGTIVDHFETERQAKDGHRVDISLTVSPIRDVTGRIIGASKIGRDIRDQKQATAAALHLAALVQSSDDAIVSKDLNGIVQSWNPAAERLFGYRAEEMIGRSITTIVPADRLEEEDYVLGRIRSGLSVEHFETVRRAKDGQPIDISLTVSPIRDHTGRVIGASKIARDIREHRRLVHEREMATASEEAARREVLEAQNLRIQEAARLKSEFVANMSHELRTPLNSIVGFAELMADERFGPLPDRYQRFARIMNSSAQHLLQLINDILDLAKVESGKIDFHPEQVEIQKVVDEATAIITGLAAKRNIRVTADVDAHMGTVELDPMRLKQVLYNYLSNAVKFTLQDGAVSIRVRPLDGDRMQIEVEDTGIGIKAEDQHRLFIEFQQLDASTAKKFEGSGLGLALTKRLVEAQGGTVGVRSEFGVGSTFWATLPKRVTATGADMTRSTRGESHEVHTHRR